MSNMHIYSRTYNNVPQMQQDLCELFPTAKLSINMDSFGPDNHFRISWDEEIWVWRTVSKTGFQVSYHRDPRRTFELHFIKEGHCTVETDEGIIDAPAGTVILLTTARHVTIKGSLGACKISIAISCAQFGVIGLDGASDPHVALADFVPRADASAPGLKNIEQLAAILLGDEGPVHPLDPCPLSAQRLRDTLILMVSETWPRQGHGTAADPNYSAALKRALKWMNGHLGEEFTISDLARECGTSVRTLQSAFKEELETGPNAYLLKLRLQQAHKDLLERQTNETVATIARRWGFKHLGYFAFQYRKLYGKHPSSVHKRT